MRIYNRYLIILAFSSSVINALLAFWGQDKLEIYFVINVIAYLIVTLLYVHFNPRAKMAVNSIGVVLFSFFMAIVALKVIAILSLSNLK